MSAVTRRMLVFTALFLAAAAPASARTVECGEVITVDTRVDNDLYCETRVALEIGADDVDLDLGGHTIEANGPEDYGIGLLISGYDDVSVVNGTLIGPPILGKGLHAPDADRLTLRRLTTRAYAPLLVTGDEARLVRVVTRGFSTTISSNGATIDRLNTTGQMDMAGHDMSVTDGDLGSIYGLQLDDSLFQRNVVRSGVFFRGSRNRVHNNQFTRGVFFGAGTGTSIQGNRTVSLGLGAGFSGNFLKNNTATGSTGFGEPPDSIFVAAGAADNVLVANTASGGADDGIDVDEPSTTLTANRAFGNADFGIEAVAGVTDGGGNRAWDNGNPLQCLNVDCG